MLVEEGLVNLVFIISEIRLRKRTRILATHRPRNDGGRQIRAECVRVVRHARECMGVVFRRATCVSGSRGDGPAWAGGGCGSSDSRRELAQRGFQLYGIVPAHVRTGLPVQPRGLPLVPSFGRGIGKSKTGGAGEGHEGGAAQPAGFVNRSQRSEAGVKRWRGVPGL
jgi:hypothetical protein